MAAPTAPIVGFNGKLYYNSGTYASPTWVLIPNVGDIKMTDDAEVSDIGVRSMGGFSVAVAGLRKVSWETSSVYDPADTVQSALYTKYGARTPTEFLVLDQASGTAGSYGMRATCMITKFPRQEELSKAMMYEWGFTPTYAANAPAAYTAS